MLDYGVGCIGPFDLVQVVHLHLIQHKFQILKFDETYENTILQCQKRTIDLQL